MGKNDYNYFEQFVNLAKYSQESAEILNETLRNFNTEELPKKILAMHNIEHSADIAKHDMMDRLVKEFVPPIEREDIITLSQNIDDVTDAVEDILIRIDIFNVKTIRPEIFEFTSLIVNACKSLTEALVEFKSFKRSSKLQSLIIEVNRIEEEGDHLYTDAVRNLYRTSTDPVELLVWSEILDRFEKCCDACEAAANDIESIVMKNS
jgi:predicted phosphate transport protein (TIGR00153 family)